uniref:Uncharacterized protein n=1 Tax=Athene cunicularia TaxID=194338 RepID=A0A663LJK8_ATHCN
MADTALPKARARSSIPIQVLQMCCPAAIAACRASCFSLISTHIKDKQINQVTQSFITCAEQQKLRCLICRKGNCTEKRLQREERECMSLEVKQGRKKAEKICFREKCNVLINKVSSGLFSTLLVSLRMFFASGCPNF